MAYGRPCVFLDRDGVININPAPGEYITQCEDLHLLPTIAEWIRLFNTMQHLVIVVTNQRCVAKGLIDEKHLNDIHDWMRMELGRMGAHIDDVYYCPHEEDVCDCRKPRPGLVYQAREKWDIDLTRSLMIGDSDRDRQLARACGLPFVCVADGRIVEIIGRDGW